MREDIIHEIHRLEYELEDAEAAVEEANRTLQHTLFHLADARIRLSDLAENDNGPDYGANYGIL